VAASPCSRTWTLLTLLTESELRALFTQVQQELATRHGQGAPLLVDVLTEDEARLLTQHRAAGLVAQVELESSRPRLAS
jgi:hypothetical protein